MPELTLQPLVKEPDYSVYEEVEPLFRRYASLTDYPLDAPERSALRERLVLLHLPLAENLAYRFCRRGEPLDDLIQVARLALVKVIDRFDPDHGSVFLSYAIPTMIGEIRRHFRDTTWHIRPPRRIHELRQQINAAIPELSFRDHRAPTARQLAEYLEVPYPEVVEGLQLASAYAPLSLDAPIGAEQDLPPLAETLGDLDGALLMVEDHEALKGLLAQLPERERRILGMRFFHDMTQTQIAAAIGVSQMQVSRLLNATLSRLRHRLLADD